MRIAIIAPGSRGDVEPYVALGRGLKQAGFDVRLVTSLDFESFVRANGVEFWPVEGNVQDIAQSSDMRAAMEGGNFLTVLSRMAKEAQRGAVALATGGAAACREADLVISGPAGLFIGIALAEKYSIPLAQAYYIPFTPTNAYPSFLVPRLPLWPGALNRLSYHLARQMMWQAFRPADGVARREVLGLPPARFAGPFNARCLTQAPVLYGYSPAVIARPPDWDRRTHVTGYWFLDGDDDWRPPATLQAFLEAGPPPVCVGFGSMSSRDPRQAADLVLHALEMSGRRAVILSGWDGVRGVDLPETAYAVESVPFTWLFARVAAVVHHGGAGTTAAGLRAGVPSVVVPFFGDQPFWGRRVAELGVGPEPIPRQQLTAERLARAIRTAVTDREMGVRAAALGAKIRAEDGVGRAVEAIQDFAARGAGA